MEDVLRWVGESLHEQNLKTYNVIKTGKANKSDGFMGNVLFITVNGITNENEPKNFDLVIKHGKKNDHLRKTAPMRLAFEMEIFIYEYVLPTFEQFQIEKNITSMFKSYPKCHKCLLYENMEVLVLENLKSLDFELHDKKVPMNLNHCKAVLREYGKLHALSFALRDQKRDKFNLLASQSMKVMENFLMNQDISDSINKGVTTALEILLKRGDIFLYKQFYSIIGKNGAKKFLEILQLEEPQSVFLHGDNWNNNLLFKYEDKTKLSPSKLAILDWQISEVRSPVFDVSLFLYAVCSKEELEHSHDLLVVYYTAFSEFLEQLGSDPRTLFTFSDLKRHWRKYSLAALINLTLLLKFVLCDKETAPDLADLKENERFVDVLDFEISEEDLYYERIKAAFQHYLENCK